MLESLNDMMFGTPARFRASLLGFFIVGAVILWLAALVRPYRRTILTLGAVLIVFYAQPLFYIISPPVGLPAQPTGSSVFERMETSMMQFRALMPWLVFIFGPLAVAAQFVGDRTNSRVERAMAGRGRSRRV